MVFKHILGREWLSQKHTNTHKHINTQTHKHANTQTFCVSSVVCFLCRIDMCALHNVQCAHPSLATTWPPSSGHYTCFCVFCTLFCTLYFIFPVSYFVFCVSSADYGCAHPPLATTWPTTPPQAGVTSTQAQGKSQRKTSPGNNIYRNHWLMQLPPKLHEKKQRKTSPGNNIYRNHLFDATSTQAQGKSTLR